MKKKFDILFNKVISKEATPEETQELLTLLNDESVKADLFEIYKEKWEQSSPNLDQEIQNRIFQSIKKEIAGKEQILKPKRSSLRHKWLEYASIAAAIIIFITGSVYFFKDNSPTSEFVVSVDCGQKAKTKLPDGSIVWLNSESSIVYSDGSNKRNVHLEGEAYFEVARNEKKPFIVHSGDIQVEVLGTSFNVRAYANEDLLTTTLMEGQVRVTHLDKFLIMSPNDKVVYSKLNKTLSKTKQEAVDATSSWRNNELAFDKETLETIAKTLERMYNISIAFENEQLKNIRFSGKIRNTNLESVLQMISTVSPVDYTLNGSQVIISNNMK